MEQLSGKVAVVTGAASGIGFALAERFAQEGMAVVLADIEPGPLAVAREKVEAHGTDALALVTDVTDPDAVHALADAASDRFGAVHVVCNNAGVGGHGGRSWETSLADWKWVVDVNVWGVVHGVQAFLPALTAQDEGHVVNTASLAAWRAVPGLAPYAVSKHAVLALSETLRLELEASGSAVGVSVICPAFINTQIFSSERNWPADAGPEPTRGDDPLSQFMFQFVTDAVAEGLPPSAVADAVVAGIRTNRFLVTPHPADITTAAEARLHVANGGAPSMGQL